jgi:glycosyltransferase involved in cell wall biosynthesis
MIAIPVSPGADSSVVPISVGHVVASVDDMAAGPSVSVPALVRALAAQGANVKLHAISGWRGAGLRPDDLGVEVRRHALDRSPLGRILGASRSMRNAVLEEGRRIDVLHSHGLWLAPNAYPASAARQRGARAKLVISPRGMLGAEALAFSSWKKKAAWAVFQRHAAQTAHCFHATAESELGDIRAAGLSQPVAVIRNGVHVPSAACERSIAYETRTVLSLGRIHPKKGLDRLVHAWKSVEASQANWRLRIVGPAENGHDVELRKIVANLGLARVSIEGPVFGQEQAKAYAEAHLFALPSLNENFAMTVAEALAWQLPVISTKGAPWGKLETNGCGWWIDQGPEAMANALLKAMRLPPEELCAMGVRGRAWMIRDFSWKRVGTDMLAVYRWLSRGGPPPETIRFA